MNFVFSMGYGTPLRAYCPTETTVPLAVNGQKGVEKFEASGIEYYDAVLMDIRMPVMDGLQAAAAIRKLNRADAKKIPIIAMTANAFDDDIKKSMDAGMNAHLSKPIDPKTMYQTIAKAIYHAHNLSSEHESQQLLNTPYEGGKHNEP